MTSLAQTQNLTPLPTQTWGVGCFVLFTQLLQHPEVVKSLQSAYAWGKIRALMTCLLAGQLTSVQVQEFLRSPSGKTLVLYAHGRPIIALVNALALVKEQQWQKALEQTSQALADPLTRQSALLLKAVIHEVQGDYSLADDLVLSEVETPDFVREAVVGLASVSIAMGTIGMAESCPGVVESCALRLREIGTLANRPGVSQASGFAFALTEAWLSGRFQEYLDQLNLTPLLDESTKRLMFKAMEADLARFAEATGGLALQYFADFRETVELLSISNLEERWNRLSTLVGRDWPEGLTATEAVIAERR